MDWSPRVLGTTASEHLQKQIRGTVLRIGKDEYTKRHLADTSCFNYVAAHNLTTVLKELGAKSTQDVYENFSPMMLAVPTIGAISLAVLGAAFELKKLGGSSPLESWVMLHRDPKDRKELQSFGATKKRAKDMEAERQTKAAARSAHKQKRQQQLKHEANAILKNGVRG